MGPDVFLCTKGMYAKFLVWFFTAMKMNIISFQIFLSILWVKINNFNTFYWICAFKLPCLAKNVDFNPQNCWNYFLKLFYVHCCDNPYQKFRTSFCPYYFISSNVIPHWTFQFGELTLQNPMFMSSS